MERHDVTSFFRRVSQSKTAVLKSVVSKPPFGNLYFVLAHGYSAAETTVFLYAVGRMFYCIKQL